MKNIIKNSGLAVFCAISTLSGAAFAQGDSAPAPKNMGFQKLDANGDGFLSKSEVEKDKTLAKYFDQADENKDGKLSEAEYTKASSLAQFDGAKEVAGKASKGASKLAGNAGQFAGDSAVTAKVKTALVKTKGVPSAAISVSTSEGRVQLAGFVDTAEQSAAAAKAAGEVEGVKTVINNIQVKNAAAKDAPKDAAKDAAK